MSTSWNPCTPEEVLKLLESRKIPVNDVKHPLSTISSRVLPSLRNDINMSNEDLACELGVSVQTIRGYMREPAKVPMDRACQLFGLALYKFRERQLAQLESIELPEELRSSLPESSSIMLSLGFFTDNQNEHIKLEAEESRAERDAALMLLRLCKDKLSPSKIRLVAMMSAQLILSELNKDAVRHEILLEPVDELARAFLNVANAPSAADDQMKHANYRELMLANEMVKPIYAKSINATYERPQAD